MRSRFEESPVSKINNKDELEIQKVVAANAFLEELKLLFGYDLRNAFFGGVCENTNTQSKNKDKYDACAFSTGKSMLLL